MSSGPKTVRCQEPGCGKSVPTYTAFERRGLVYCEAHVLNTAEKRAYERECVDPKS